MTVDYARKEDHPLDREAILAFAKRAYGWTVMWDGELAGLVAGDMGYGESGVNLGLLVSHAIGESSNSPRCDEITRALEHLVGLCIETLGGDGMQS